MKTRLTILPAAIATLLSAGNASAADHIMPNYRVNLADTADVAAQRRAG